MSGGHFDLELRDMLRRSGRRRIALSFSLAFAAVRYTVSEQRSAHRPRFRQSSSDSKEPPYRTTGEACHTVAPNDESLRLSSCSPVWKPVPLDGSSPTGERGYPRRCTRSVRIQNPCRPTQTLFSESPDAQIQRPCDGTWSRRPSVRASCRQRGDLYECSRRPTCQYRL